MKQIISSAVGREEADPLDVRAGEQVRLRREAVGMTQKELGEALGVSFQQIQKYERGANRMAYSTAHRIAGCLGVGIGWFEKDLNFARAGFGEGKQAPLEGAPPAAAGLPEDIFERKETFDLLRAYYAIADSQQRRDVYTFIKSMNKNR